MPQVRRQSGEVMKLANSSTEENVDEFHLSFSCLSHSRVNDL
jgi:hypothetical protein